jgi:hypothetical protein
VTQPHVGDAIVQPAYVKSWKRLYATSTPARDKQERSTRPYRYHQLQWLVPLHWFPYWWDQQRVDGRNNRADHAEIGWQWLSHTMKPSGYVHVGYPIQATLHEKKSILHTQKRHRWPVKIQGADGLSWELLRTSAGRNWFRVASYFHALANAEVLTDQCKSITCEIASWYSGTGLAPLGGRHQQRRKNFLSEQLQVASSDRLPSTSVPIGRYLFGSVFIEWPVRYFLLQVEEALWRQ